MKWASVVLVLLATVGLAPSSNSKTKIDWNKVTLTEVFPKRLLGNATLESVLNRNPSNRIIGGEISPAGKFPHQAGVLSNYGGWCGGALISDLYVLTAAHCTDECSYVTVYLGAQNIRDDDEVRLEIVVNRDSIEVHHAWDVGYIMNDISLVQFPRRIQFTDRIQPISLPTRSEARYDLEDMYLTASGWGLDSNDGMTISPQLRYVTLRVQPATICKHFFSELIKDSNICTDTGRGQGTCNGDSGGPLINARADGTPYIVGATSFGSSIGCVVGWPSVFTRVGSFLNWIRDNTDIIIQE